MGQKTQNLLSCEVHGMTIEIKPKTWISTFIPQNNLDAIIYPCTDFQCSVIIIIIIIIFIIIIIQAKKSHIWKPTSLLKRNVYKAIQISN